MNKEVFWIFGSGTFALSIYKACLENGIEILGIIDKAGADFAKFAGFDISKLTLGSQAEIRQAPIYLAVCNPYVDLRQLDYSIRKFTSLNDVRGPVELCKLFSRLDIYIENYWLTSRFEVYENSQSEIESFEEILGDSDSRTLYSEIIRYRKSGEISKLPTRNLSLEQYLPSGIPTPPKELKMLELGSCGGENLSTLLQSGRSVLQSFAFEPDAVNFRRLKNQVSDLKLNSLFPMPLAAWDVTTQLSFSGSGGTNSSIDLDGGEWVQAVSIDDLIPPDCAINYIKMDIEGAEFNALIGATETIKRQTPHMAVCVYHKPSHLWELGLWINSTFPGKYQFFMRSYAEQTFETVLYCVPL